MPSLPNPIKIATKGVELGVQVGSFVAGQAFQKIQSLVGENGRDDTYSPTPQPRREDQPQERSPQPTRLESVKTPGETSTGSKPTTAATTATGPGGAGRMAPKAPAKKKAPARRKATAAPAKAVGRTGPRSAGGRITNPKAAAKARKRNAGASAKTGAGKGTGQSAGSRTGARSAGGRISNPKAAAKARKRAAAASAKTGVLAKAKAKGTGDAA